MGRVQFPQGEQRRFLRDVLQKLHCPSLRAFSQFGLDVPYSTLKNYSNESRLLPLDFFKQLCFLAKIDPSTLPYSILGKHWGQIKGGKKKSV